MSRKSNLIWRRRNPHRFSYQNLKAHAKYRRIPFELTFVQFLEIPEIDKYVFGKGRGKLDWTMDRKLPLSKEPRGYCAGNCQVITNSDNVRKRWKEYDQLPYNPEGVPF
jgi:hypothetical protein